VPGHGVADFYQNANEQPRRSHRTESLEPDVQRAAEKRPGEADALSAHKSLEMRAPYS
jgi:hypothetical protein